MGKIAKAINESSRTYKGKENEDTNDHWKMLDRDSKMHDGGIKRHNLHQSCSLRTPMKSTGDIYKQNVSKAKTIKKHLSEGNHSTHCDQVSYKPHGDRGSKSDTETTEVKDVRRKKMTKRSSLCSKGWQKKFRNLLGKLNASSHQSKMDFLTEKMVSMDVGNDVGSQHFQHNTSRQCSPNKTPLLANVQPQSSPVNEVRSSYSI